MTTTSTRTRTVIICCGIIPGWWAKVSRFIAWVQIILSVTGVFTSFLLAFDLLRVLADEAEGGKSVTGLLDMIVMICVPLLLVISILGSAFGVVLLVGVNQKNKACLRCWNVYMALGWLLGLGFAVIFPSVWTVAYVFISLALNGSCIIIVWLVIMDIRPSNSEDDESDNRNPNPNGGWQRFMDNMSPAPPYSAALPAQHQHQQHQHQQQQQQQHPQPIN